MKELLNKLANAKLEIKNTNIKKDGWNDYSKYAYFTPDQIEHLVALACKNNKLLTTFDLIRNDLGIYGVLTIYDIESGKDLKVQMATEIPNIKATNIAQQLGGCVTYTERYLKTSVFGITDNRLDFDTTENTKKQNNKKEYTAEEKKAFFLKEIQARKQIAENGGHDFNDVIAKCGYDTMKDIDEVLPLQYRSCLDAIDRKLSQLGVKK